VLILTVRLSRTWFQFARCFSFATKEEANGCLQQGHRWFLARFLAVNGILRASIKLQIENLRSFSSSADYGLVIWAW
jgi:hypothetical protein